MIVITGASGNTGSVAAESLLAAGEKVRVVGRLAEKLAPIAAKSAEIFVCDVNNSSDLTRAFDGADAAYVMVPPNLAAENVRQYQLQVAESIATALEQAKVSHAVLLSSVGAQLSEGAGPVSGLHHVEERLKRVAGLNILSLRAAYFMENLLLSMKMIQSAGIFAGLNSGDLAMPMIATRDIGERAATELRSRAFSGFQTKELLGPRDYTMDEAAKVIGAAIGKPKLSYTKAPAFMAKPALRAAGLS
ncbi:MAG TPA: NAD(P)H-binding protein, partial [Candidatus Acidoferrales bacterium]|nr:NAD(P)H-binding protein [Candidatus Acidoferrales bacterium]